MKKDKKKKNPLAVALAEIRWSKTTPEQKAKHIANINAKRKAKKEKERAEQKPLAHE